MYSLILAAALASPEQCVNGVCPLQRVAAVAFAPVQAVQSAVRGECSGRSARFAVAPRGGCAGTVAVKGGCGGIQVAATAPPIVVKPPLPMAPPPVAVIPVLPPIAPPVAVQGPSVAVVAVKQPADVYRKAHIRTFLHNRGVCF